MGNTVKISKPISTEAKHHDVYRFSQISDKSSILFVKPGDKRVWKSEKQRDLIFSKIYSAEQATGLEKKTVIHVRRLAKREYEYSYRKEGKLHRKQVTLEKKGAEGDKDAAVVAEKPIFYKVQDVSLRKFQQIEVTNAIIEFLQAVLEILATPFAYLYQLIAGSGDPRNFASMLVPVEHDRVGEITHDAVLSQMKFVGRLFAKEDPTHYGSGLGLKAENEFNAYYADHYRPVRQTSTGYKIWMGANDAEPNPDYDQDEIDDLKRQLVEAEGDGDNVLAKQLTKEIEELQKVPKEIWPEVWVSFEKKNPPDSAPDPFLENLKKDHESRDHAHWPNTTEVKFKGEWIEIPKTHPSVKNLNLVENHQVLTENESNPQIFSAAQEVSRVFTQAHEIGKEWQDALNAGTQVRKKAAIQQLTSALLNLKNTKHFVLPLAQGEGRDYLPHFLVFVKDERSNRILLKHVCFSSTALDSDRMQVVSTYDVTNSVSDLEVCKRFARSLFNMQPYARGKDSKERTLKGPIFRDHSLDSILLKYGRTVGAVENRERKASRDPIRAIYTIIEELKTEEHWGVPADKRVLEKITESKARFYSVYVNNLISYYEDNESRLLPSERTRALEGILWYTKQVRHYMENEMGADAALAITEHLNEFVTKKLDELGRTEALEQLDVQNLKNKASLFEGDLAESLEETLKKVSLSKGDVEGSRVSPKEWQSITLLRTKLQGKELEGEDHKDERLKLMKLCRELRSRAESYLKQGNTLAAKTLLLGVLQALPPADNGTDKHKTFWDALDETEMTPWIKELEDLAERFFEASLRSGTYPLKPHEVFEFNVVLPLIQRYLFKRLIPIKMESIVGADGILKTYKDDEEIVRNLEAARLKFITMREKEIEAETTREYKRKWKDEDSKDASQLAQYTLDLDLHKHRVANYEKYKDHKDLNLRAENPHPGLPPNRPTIRKENPEARKRDLEEAIQHNKDTDDFLIDLKEIDVKTFDNTTWDNWIDVKARCDRTIAVFGNFARIMGISKEDYAYKMGGEHGWIGNSFDSTNKSIWLMNQDCSVLIGSSPAFEKRYEVCKRALNYIVCGNKVSAQKATHFYIGYNRLGDGTQTPAEYAIQATMKEMQRGFFNPSKGTAYFVPEEMASLRKVDEMRKLLRNPVHYLESHAAGIGDALRGLFGEEHLSSEGLRKKFAKMRAIHLVVAENEISPFFTLSKKPTEEGNLKINNYAEEPATHIDRQNFMGQISPEMASKRVGGDQERENIEDAANEHLYKALDPAEEAILRETALAKGAVPDELSYLSISQCMHFIYQYPEKLELPQVQHTLHKTFFQRELISNQIKNNPEFFVEVGGVLNEVCKFMQGKGDTHLVSELFIREVCERIRQQATALKDKLIKKYGKDWATEISNALPTYNEKNIVGIFTQKTESNEQKSFATFALCYFAHNIPKKTDVSGWRDLLNAYYLLQKSPFESGHSGLQEELKYTIQKVHLPRIAKYLSDNPEMRTELLGQLSGKKEVQWSVDDKKPYTYTLDGEKFAIDLRTGDGFCLVPRNGERCRLPEQIRTNANFRLLFKDANPMVASDPGRDGIVDYHWKDEKGGNEFVFRYNKEDNHSVQIYQLVDDKESDNKQIFTQKKYQFQKLNLSTKWSNKLWQIFARHDNKTIENMISAKGVWIAVDADDNIDTSKVLLAQYGWNLDKDPITVNIRSDKITGATLGKGKDKKWICSGLADRDSKLLSFRGGAGLLLLSKDKIHVDEVRFPPDRITKEQLILKKGGKDSWVVAGREDWVWQMTNTKTYEKRFGKNWREYILPLKNKRTQEEEIWIFPHMVVGSGKHGGGVKFLKHLPDFLDYFGGSAGPNGLPQNLDAAEMRRAAGAAESFMGGMQEVLDAVDGDADQGDEAQNSLMQLLKSSASPRQIRYRLDRRSETSSHAGFLYLSYVASLNGDWGNASRYLQLMMENGSNASVDDLKQLKNMANVVFKGKIMQTREESALLPKTPMEAAYKAKLASALITLNTRLKAQHGQELFDKAEDRELLAAASGAIYLEYRHGLTTHRQRLEDNGLLLTHKEEKVFTSDVTQFATGALVLEKLKKETNPDQPLPFQLKLPNQSEMNNMVDVMASYVQRHGVWSIHDLHKEHGSYPKWETVLANFWEYWEWIQSEDLKVEDVAFLLRHMQPLSDKASEAETMKWKAIDTARRTLLAFWHYKKNDRYEAVRGAGDFLADPALREVKNYRLKMPNFAEMQEKKQRYEQEAEMEPGIFNAFCAHAYSMYVGLKTLANEHTFKETVGGVERERGIKHDFVVSSKCLLERFLKFALQQQIQDGHVLHPDSINIKVNVNPPKTPPKKTLFDKEKEKAWGRFILINKGPMGPMLQMLWKDANAKKIFRPVFDAFFDLPSFDYAWKQMSTGFPQLIETMIALSPAEQESLNLTLDAMKDDVHAIYDQHALAVGYSTQGIYPRQVEKARYEAVEVKPKADPEWGNYFMNSLDVWDRDRGTWVKKSSVWEKRKVEAKEEFDPAKVKSLRAKAKLEKICKGIDVACDDLIKRTAKSFQVKALKSVYQRVSESVKRLREEDLQFRGRIMDFARQNAQELGLMFLFANKDKVTDEQIIQQIYELYRLGQLGRLDDEGLQKEFAELITESILTATEMQQYQKALGICKDLAEVVREIKRSLPKTVKGEEYDRLLQSLANTDTDWLLYSAELKRCLQEGADRLRYTEEVDGKHMLKDQRFNRRYLVGDVRNQWIQRKRAVSALEDMLKDMVEKGNGEPVRFIKAKMGTGKSEFVFPEATDLLIQRGYEPIIVTTDDLVDQLKVSMGHKAFVFKFSIDFGLDKVHENELDKLDETRRKERWKKLNEPKSIEEHLSTLAKTLENLKQSGKAVLTAPSQIAALSDKRVQLQGMLAAMQPGELRTQTFNQVQLLKRIEAHFKKEKAVYLVDEDINYDIAFEYNFATGDYRTVDACRFEMAEKVIRTIKSKHPELWQMIVDKNLRAVRDVAKELKPVVRNIFLDFEFWKNLGWDPNVWRKIDQDQFCDYILGLRKDRPKGLPKWDTTKPDDKQQEKAYVAALKTLLSKTFESVRGVNPSLERGISAHNGVTVVPFSDGKEKSGVLYGEESENILHHIFHYIGEDTQIGEDIYLQKYKDLGGMDLRISPLYRETWRDWASSIADVYNKNRWTEQNTEGYKSHYEAFTKSRDLAMERMLFLRHMMLQTDFIRVFHEQITFNSQDLGIGTDVRVGSGTGQPFALNLSDYTDKANRDPDEVLGETLLCLKLKKPTTTFRGTPLEHIEEKARDPRCHAILNYDYEVLGNDCEKLTGRLRGKVDRQFIYRIEEEQQLVKKIWNPGEHFFPMGYEPEAIDEEKAFFIYSRRDSRGVHFHVPRGGHKYGEAMLGTGNQEDAIAQLIWRLRHMDLGHEMHFSHDEKTELQIRKACGVKDEEQVTIGHAMRYFTLNTIGEENVKNVKAVIFKEQIPLKKHINAQVRKPYDMSRIGESECIEDIEGKAVFKAAHVLNVMTNHTRWVREYQAHKSTDPVTFIKGLCKEELKKIKLMREKFEKEIEKVVEEHQGADAALIFNHGLLGSLIDPANVEESIDKILTPYKNDDPKQLAVAREILRKYHAVLIGFGKAAEEIKAERKRLDDPEYQKFLQENLPEELSVDLDEGARNEQKIQQLQEQKREQKQEKMQRVMQPARGHSHTNPINYARFKDVVLGAVGFETIGTRYPWVNNGNFLPLTTVVKQELHLNLDADDFKNIYVSDRAWALLQKMGRVGAPAVEILVIEDPQSGESHGVIITPAEREQTVADALIEERKNVGKKTAPPPPPPPAISEDDAFAEIRDAIASLALFFSGMVKAALNTNKATIMPYVRKFLNQPNAEQAWQGLRADLPAIVQAIGYGQYVGALMMRVDDVKADVLSTHAKKIPQPPPAPKPTVECERIAVYPLSNENFSRMLMDCVKKPDEKSKDFVQMMTMIKLFLNWTQFSLVELDYLVEYVGSLSNFQAQFLNSALAGIHGNEIYKNADGFVESHSPKTSELLKKIRRKDADWLLSVAKRKLNANLPIKRYSNDEIKVLEKWIIKMAHETDFLAEINQLKALHAVPDAENHSVQILNDIRKKIKKTPR